MQLNKNYRKRKTSINLDVRMGYARISRYEKGKLVSAVNLSHNQFNSLKMMIDEAFGEKKEVK